MPIHRRGALAAPLLLLARRAPAQDGFPDHAISVLSGYTPGGVTDVTSRAVAERMGRALGVPVVVENRAGAATAVANTAVAQAKPDGYTLLMGTSTLAINPALQPALGPKSPMTELVPIGMVFRTAFVLHVHPGLPVRTPQELIVWARDHPGALNFGSSGTGAVNHLAQALFTQRADIAVTHIPYKGGAPALLDLRAGRIQAMFQAVLEALPSLSDGGTRGLGISSAERSPLLPNLPPLADTLPGFDVVFWQGLFAPAGTPAPILARLEAALRQATEDPALRARMAESGVAITTGDAAMLAKTLADETKIWGGLIRDSGIRAE
jgi:tripartite-type tricarboxylate transporter receptor subunit TctC